MAVLQPNQDIQYIFRLGNVTQRLQATQVMETAADLYCKHYRGAVIIAFPTFRQ
jgi:hypothetical protein